jgi:flagellar basal-body rod modification protein FlgD
MDPATATPAATLAATPATLAPAATATLSSGSGHNLSGDFKTFLTLLTSQLRNQDPLKPVESTEFVAQLATFSAVEQQVQTNDKLEAILDALTGGPNAGLSEWIGKEVRAVAAVPFDGATPLSLHANPADGAELSVLVVKDAAGAERARLTVDPKAEDLSWAGESLAGKLPAGTYSFAIESYAGGSLVATRGAEVFAEVVEVRRDGLDTVLVLKDGTKISADQVQALRLPG